MLVSYFDSGNNIGFNAAHQVNFHPLMTHPFFSPFVVKTLEFTGAEAGRVHGKVRFDSLERKAGLNDEIFQERRHRRISQIAEDGVVIGGDIY